MSATSPATAPDASTSFSVLAHHWAAAWSDTAPGWGGWDVNVDVDEHGEQITVAPPCSDVACFAIRPGLGDDVEMTVMVEGEDGALRSYPTLQDALLEICPLSPAQRTEVDALAALWAADDGLS
jgi:hypothetical protein